MKTVKSIMFNTFASNNKRKGARRLYSVLFIGMLALSCVSAALACTQWASIGSVNRDGGTLFAKNRDAGLAGRETMALRIPKKGYPYLALAYNHSAQDKDYPYITWGINKAGLLISVSSASTTPAQGDQDLGETQLMENVLQNYGSVAEALKAAPKIFMRGHMGNYILTDRKEIATVELAPNGQYVITHTRRGYLFHTNNYIAPSLQEFNQIENYASTYVRWQTLRKLLIQNEQRKFTPDLYESWMRRRKNGPDNSLFRRNTLAHILVDYPVGKPITVDIQFTHPDQKPAHYRYVLDKRFWQEKNLQKTGQQKPGVEKTMSVPTDND